MAKVSITGSINEKIRVKFDEAFLGRQHHRSDAALGNLCVLNPRMQQNLRPRFKHESFPNYFEIFGVVSDPCPCPVGVWPFETSVEFLKFRDDIIPNAADDFQRARARSIETIKSIENRRAGPTQEPITFDQQGARSSPTC